MIRAAAAAVLLFAASCDGIPKDTEGTTDRIRSERQFRVGLIQGSAVGEERQRFFLQEVARSVGGKPGLRTGAAEPLLAQLETGEIDLVLGPMIPVSPWQKKVHFLPPLGEQVSPEGHIHFAAMARNGENEWITLLHRAARKTAAMP